MFHQTSQSSWETRQGSLLDHWPSSGIHVWGGKLQVRNIQHWKNICHLHLCFVRRRPRGFRRKAQKPPYQIGPYQSPPSSQDIIRHVSDTCPAPARHVGGPYEAVSPVVTSVGGVPGTEYSSHGVDSLLQTSHSSSFVPFNNNHVLSSVPGSNFFSQNDL